MKVTVATPADQAAAAKEYALSCYPDSIPTRELVITDRTHGSRYAAVRSVYKVQTGITTEITTEDITPEHLQSIQSGECHAHGKLEKIEAIRTEGKMGLMAHRSIRITLSIVYPVYQEFRTLKEAQNFAKANRQLVLEANRQLMEFIATQN